MNSYKYLFFACMFYFNAFSQSIEVEKSPFFINYIELPDNPLPESYANYNLSIIVENQKKISHIISSEELDQTFEIPGFHRVSENADFTIHVLIQDVKIGKGRIVPETRNFMDDDGNPQSLIVYHSTMGFFHPMHLKVISQDGRTFLDEDFGTEESTEFFKSKACKDQEEAKNAFYDEFASAHEAYFLTQINSLKMKLRKSIAYTPTRSENEYFLTLNKTNHKYYDKMMTAYESAKTCLEGMNFTEKPSARMAGIESAIEIWNEITEEYSKGNKRKMKVRHACLWNLALINFWMEDFETAEMYTDQLLEIDIKDGFGRNLKRKISNVKNEMENCEKESRYFYVTQPAAKPQGISQVDFKE